MMLDVEIKSTATLIDEYITAELKCQALYVEGKDITAVQQRLAELKLAINMRVPDKNAIESTVIELANVLKECWDAQEVTRRYMNLTNIEDIVAHSYEIAVAGITAQRTNAKRNAFIRQIDEILGEAEKGQLVKTYG